VIMRAKSTSTGGVSVELRSILCCGGVTSVCYAPVKSGDAREIVFAGDAREIVFAESDASGERGWLTLQTSAAVLKPIPHVCTVTQSPLIRYPSSYSFCTAGSLCSAGTIISLFGGLVRNGTWGKTPQHLTIVPMSSLHGKVSDFILQPCGCVLGVSEDGSMRWINVQGE
jgi:hypothetical protein